MTENGGMTWEEMDSGLPDRYVTDLYFDPLMKDHYSAQLGIKITLTHLTY